MTKHNNADVFANIAATRVALRKDSLIEPKPQKRSYTVYDLHSFDKIAAFSPASRIDTRKKLQQELQRQRKRHSRFLNDFAPPLPGFRQRINLDTFDYRLQTQADLDDFSSVLHGRGKWDRITVPHYGAPLGRVDAYYRTTFRLTKVMLNKRAVFVSFKGVDYKAHVFINGHYAGSHEGFFAPFDFDFTPFAKLGINTLVVKVENDFICMGNESWDLEGRQQEGDKIYAATGCGYDEPVTGWHHCPPGMGIYQPVTIESRPKTFVSDIFVRPILESKQAELRFEVHNCELPPQDIAAEISIFGQNFKKSVLRGFKPELKYAGPGVNYYRIRLDINNPRVWNTETPWLYQVQLRLLDEKNNLIDTASRQFGMRSFTQDVQSMPKGKLYFNEQEIRLRGINTMGHMQRCVMHKDFDQLIDDILLYKICNMNFIRLTQRPVQDEIYEHCDKLGMMTQTDLPLFACLRRNQFNEAVKQAGEMERLVRGHCCNILVSYINEPFAEASGKPQRHLLRDEMEVFFASANNAVLLENPDRVIKPVDGDYDPPAPGLPDNHCYSCWYNGHGVELGKLHKGYWQQVKPDWHYGCGEFGAEGLDFEHIMWKHYPKTWLPQDATQEAAWTPDEIPKAQTGRLHYLWYQTPKSLSEWVQASQTHQAWAVRVMTEAFRRDERMNSCTVFHGIDAFPAGWMKSIMDVDRNPKPAYFACMDALTPLMVSLRTDRFRFYAGETINVEAWICNDNNHVPKGLSLHYQLEHDHNTILAGKADADVPLCSSHFQGFIKFRLPKVDSRTQYKLRLGLVNENGKTINDSTIDIEAFAKPQRSKPTEAHIIGEREGVAHQLADSLGLISQFDAIGHSEANLILIDDISTYSKNRRRIDQAIRAGATAIFLELPQGTHSITSCKIDVSDCGMNPRHFVSADTGHELVKDCKHDDFFFWYDEKYDYVTPLINRVFQANAFTEILLCGDGNWEDHWQPRLAVAEKKVSKGVVRICQLQLSGRVRTNPTAATFARRLLRM